MARIAKAYTAIPLEKLDYIRLELRAKLKQLEASTGERYAIRTFYCGPRKKHRTHRPASTLKTMATAAKLGIYKVEVKYYGFSGEAYEQRVLDRYI